MKKIFFSFLLITISVFAFAQDALLSQFNDENLNRNPGLAGIFRGDYMVNAIYRNQWAYLNSPINTAYIQAQNKILIKDGLRDFFTIGFNASKDAAGSLALQNTYANASLTFNKLKMNMLRI
jgi:Type IX secretion system membrane protein PorP/SprF